MVVVGQLVPEQDLRFWNSTALEVLVDQVPNLGDWN